MKKSEKYLFFLFVFIFIFSIEMNEHSFKTNFYRFIHSKICSIYDTCMFSEVRKHDPIFDPIIKKIEDNMSRYAGVNYKFNISVSFEDITKDDYIAFCYKHEQLDNKFITIRRDYFTLPLNNEMEDELELTLLHEIGHCIFDKEHDENFIYLANIRVPETVMQTRMMPILIFNKFKGYYYRNLVLSKPTY